MMGTILCEKTIFLIKRHFKKKKYSWISADIVGTRKTRLASIRVGASTNDGFTL